MPSGFPLSVTAWLYFESAPGPSDTWTIWWYGRTAVGNDHLILEATQSGASDVQLTARLKGALGQVQATRVVTTGEWHCVSVVVTGPSAPFTVDLYVDDAAVQSASGTPGTVTPTGYDRFALAAAQGSGQPANPGAYFCEHIATWNEALGAGGGGSPSDNERMFDDRLPPQDGADLAIVSDLSYRRRKEYCHDARRQGSDLFRIAGIVQCGAG
ncbi:MAG: LamG-like jellyroll fold domain-containing protein [Phycisphaerales bacterium JB039]